MRKHLCVWWWWEGGEVGYWVVKLTSPSFPLCLFLSSQLVKLDHLYHSQKTAHQNQQKLQHHYSSSHQSTQSVAQRRFQSHMIFQSRRRKDPVPTSEVHEGHRLERPIGIRRIHDHPAFHSIACQHVRRGTEQVGSGRGSGLHFSTEAEQKMKLPAAGGGTGWAAELREDGRADWPDAAGKHCVIRGSVGMRHHWVKWEEEAWLTWVSHSLVHLWSSDWNQIGTVALTG